MFSHIVSRRLSTEFENVVTEGLAYILTTVPTAKRAFIDLLRAAEPGLSSELVLAPQDAEGSTRPDLAGTGPDGRREVFAENKFWAGFTAQQPVEYMRRLAGSEGAALLVVVVPEARVATVYPELERRLELAEIGLARLPCPASFSLVAETTLGPRLALTTWRSLLLTLAHGIGPSSEGKTDLDQLRSLCDAADRDAFIPFAAEELSDQTVPMRIVQLSDLVREVIAAARVREIINLEGLRATHNWRRAGSYLRLGSYEAIGAWFGLDFGAWRKFGRSPLWLRFENDRFSRAAVVRPRLLHWGDEHRRFVVDKDDQVLVAVDVLPGKEREPALEHVLAQLASLGTALRDVLSAAPAGEPPTPTE